MSEQITSRFRALDCLKNTADQNKRHIVPHILRARPARTVEEVPGPVLQEPGKHWAGVQWKNSEGDLVFENVERRGTGQWCSNLFKNDLSKRPGKYIWRNVLCTTETDPFNSGLKWGCREYNVPHREFIDCDFFAIPREHGVYASNYEGTVVDRCTFVRMGSQGVQFAHRPMSYQQYSADNRPYEAKPQHVLKDSHFIDCAEGGDRPSYNATYFNPGSPAFPGTLTVENCSFVNKWEEPKGGYQSTGALVVTPLQGNEPLVSNFMERVEVTNCLFDFTAGDRSIINIRSTNEVIIEDCAFIARDHGRANVDIDSPSSYMGDSKTKRIILRNCVAVGEVNLRIFGEDATGWTDNVSVPINTRGKEVIIDGGTGRVISERVIAAEDPAAQKLLAERIAAARKKYFGTR